MQRLRFSLFLFLSLIAIFCGCSGNFNKKEWKIAVDPSWYPISFMGKEKQLMGFTTDLLQEISKVEKMRITRIQENWDNLIPHLQQEKYDGILSSIYPYIFYEKQYDFSKPFLLTGSVLVLPEASKVTSLDKLSGKEIAIISGSGDSLILEKYPGIIIREYLAIPDALNDIMHGTVDGALIEILPASAYCQDIYYGQLKVVGEPFTDQGLRLITLHGRAPALIESFNSGLEKLKASGKYAELALKWGFPADTKN